MKRKMEIATFGAGCFWSVQYIFDRTTGVKNTRVGYTGGEKVNPTYNDVCSGETGHAESVEIEFDPKIVSYKELLNVFWKNHDPTTKDRQGPDIGTQYRSVIFYHNPKQKKEAEESKKEWQKKIEGKIMTEIVKAKEFYEAEEYHQKYLEAHPGACHIYIRT